MNGVSLLRARIKRCWNSAKHVHIETGENTVILFIEVVYSWLRYGASDEDFLTMEFYRKNAREKRRWLTSAKNNRYLYKTVYDKIAIETFDNKELFDQTFKGFLRHDFLVLSNRDEETIRSFIRKYKTVIVKPTGGACGVGVFLLAEEDEQGIISLIERVKKGERLIMEEVIVQHPDMARMNPASVNTIRVITMVDREGNVHIINQCAKFGASSQCISNTMGGGFCCHINADSGIIDAQGKDIHGRYIFKHPISGIPIPGFQIPHWNGVLDYACQLATVVPSARYIGWDIVITDHGYDVIEGNIHPGQDFQGCDGVGRWNQIKSLI